MLQVVAGCKFLDIYLDRQAKHHETFIKSIPILNS